MNPSGLAYAEEPLSRQIQIRHRDHPQWIMRIPAELITTDRAWTQILSLLACLADALWFTRHGAALGVVAQDIPDVPWHAAIGTIILHSFRAQLQSVLPDGVWGLELIDR